MLDALFKDARLQGYGRYEFVPTALIAAFLRHRSPDASLLKDEDELIVQGHFHPIHLPSGEAVTEWGVPPMLLYLWHSKFFAQNWPLLTSAIEFLRHDDPLQYTGRDF